MAKNTTHKNYIVHDFNCKQRMSMALIYTTKINDIYQDLWMTKIARPKN